MGSVDNNIFLNFLQYFLVQAANHYILYKKAHLVDLHNLFILFIFVLSIHNYYILCCTQSVSAIDLLIDVHQILFSKVEQFWSFYGYLMRPGELTGHSDIHLFKDGIKPMWEVSMLFANTRN